MCSFIFSISFIFFGVKSLFTEGDSRLLGKQCRSMVTLQKPISIRGNVVSNTSYKDWVCQLSSETNKPFLTSCLSPPTITGPEEVKTDIYMKQTTHHEFKSACMKKFRCPPGDFIHMCIIK